MTQSQILGIKDPQGLLLLQPADYISGFTAEEFDYIFSVCGASWFHDGTPEMPHAVTRKDMCTDGFIDTLEALSYTNICFILATKAVNMIRRKYSGPIGWVIGSDHAGAAISLMIAFILGARHDFTEKDPTDPDGRRHLWKRRIIKPGEIVLQAEELVTTKGTLEEVRKAITVGNPFPVQYAPVSYTCVHRSDAYEVFGDELLYDRHYDIKTWPESVCPLCRSGSRRIKNPKKNWAELNGIIT